MSEKRTLYSETTTRNETSVTTELFERDGIPYISITQIKGNGTIEKVKKASSHEYLRYNKELVERLLHQFDIIH